MTQNTGMDVDSEQHAKYLGKLVANIQSLETVLRLCLLVAEMPKEISGPEYHELRLGEAAREDAFTDYRTLWQAHQGTQPEPTISGTETR